MTKIVIVDNHGQFTHLEGRALRDLGVDHEIVDNSRSADDVLSSEVDGVVLSGGPSLDETGCCDEYLERDLPVLGICLGHQVIAREYGGEVSSGDYGGFADVDVVFLENDGIFEGLGGSVSAWASHGDEVSELPDGFVRTAESEICDIEAMRHESKPVFGVQWHPEVSHTEKGLDLLENFVGIAASH